MKKSESISLFISLQGLGNLTGAKFSYAIARNINILKPIIEKYQEERKLLQESFAKKDKDKKPILEDKGKKDEQGNPVKEYTFENEEEFTKEYEKLVNENVKVELYKIKLQDVPKEITPQQMAGIYEVIEEK